MPDLSKCAIDSNGNYWCLDYKTRKIYRIKLEEPYMVPQEVIDLLNKIEGAEAAPPGGNQNG